MEEKLRMEWFPIEITWLSVFYNNLNYSTNDQLREAFE